MTLPPIGFSYPHLGHTQAGLLLFLRTITLPHFGQISTRLHPLMLPSSLLIKFFYQSFSNASLSWPDRSFNSLTARSRASRALTWEESVFILRRILLVNGCSMNIPAYWTPSIFWRISLRESKRLGSSSSTSISRKSSLCFRTLIFRPAHLNMDAKRSKFP